MAKLTQEQYQKRKENAIQRQEENKKIETLTEEQHDALAELCSIRHEVHSATKSMYYTESSTYSELWSRLEEIYDHIKELKIGDLKLRPFEQFPCDNDRTYGIIDDTDEAEEKNIVEFFDMMNDLNNEIEEFLRKIDKQHGTNYAPSGALRLFN